MSDELDKAVALAESSKPIFWYRPRSDGLYEGPIHNAQIEQVRQESGAWVPMFTRQQVIEELANKTGVMPEIVFAQASVNLTEEFCKANETREAIATMQAKVDQAQAYNATRTNELAASVRQCAELQARVVELEKNTTDYESALKCAFPSGASGATFDYWNAARQPTQQSLRDAALKRIADVGVWEEYPGHHNNALHHRCKSCCYRWAVVIEQEHHADECAAQIARAALQEHGSKV